MRCCARSNSRPKIPWVVCSSVCWQAFGLWYDDCSVWVGFLAVEPAWYQVLWEGFPYLFCVSFSPDVRCSGWGQTQVQKIPTSKMAVLTRGLADALVDRCQVAVLRFATICTDIAEGESRYPYQFDSGTIPDHELEQVVWFLTFMQLDCSMTRSPPGPYVDETRVILRELINISFLLYFPEEMPPIVRDLVRMFHFGEEDVTYFVFPEGEWSASDRMVWFGYYVVDDGGFVRYREDDTIVVQLDTVVEDDGTVEERPSSLDGDIPEYDSDGNVAESEPSTGDEAEADRVLSVDMVVS
jgi:hypothetical protein